MARNEHDSFHRGPGFPVALDAMPDLALLPRGQRKPERVRPEQSDDGPYVEWAYDAGSPVRRTSEEERKGVLTAFLGLGLASNAPQAVASFVRTYGPLAHGCEHQQDLATCSRCQSIYWGSLTYEMRKRIFYWRIGELVPPASIDVSDALPMRESISVYVEPARKLLECISHLAGLRLEPGPPTPRHDETGRWLTGQVVDWLNEWQLAGVDWQWRLEWLAGKDRMRAWAGIGVREEIRHRVVKAFEHPASWYICTGCGRAYERDIRLPKPGQGNFCEVCRDGNYMEARKRRRRDKYHRDNPDARYKQVRP